MKKILLMTMLVFSLNANNLYIGKKDNRYGFLDYNNNYIIKPIYDRVRPFNKDGLSRVIYNGKVGVINKTGKFVIPAKYDNIGRFSVDGFSIITQNDKEGYIDKTGKIIIKPSYQTLYQVTEKYFKIKLNDKWGLIDKNEKVIIKPHYENLELFSHKNLFKVVFIEDGEKYMKIVDINDKTILEKNRYYISNYDSGVFKIRENGLEGLIDENAKIVLKPTYKNIGWFRDGLAEALKSEKGGYISDYIDPKGSVVIKDVRDTDGFYDSLAKFKKDDLYGYIDTKGNVVIENTYSYAKNFNCGVAFVDEGNGEYLIDKKGVKLSNLDYKNVGIFNEFCVATVNDGRYTGLVNSSGKQILKLQYDSITDMDDSGLFVVGLNQKYALFNKNIKQLTDFKYDKIATFSYLPYAMIEVDKKYGLLDINGKVVIEPLFNIFRPSKNEIKVMLKNNKIGIISYKGEYINFTKEEIQP